LHAQLSGKNRLGDPQAGCDPGDHSDDGENKKDPPSMVFSEGRSGAGSLKVGTDFKKNKSTSIAKI
jgi:hypothetical protein